FKLENYVKEKYGLESLEIIPNEFDDNPTILSERISQVAAGVLRNLIDDNMKIGFSWGKSLSNLVDLIHSKSVRNVHFYPLAGGPSHIHAKYHVNTLIYEMSRKFHGECTFMNATIVQENKLLADGILQSRYFENLKNSWKDLDIAVVGIGDFSNKGKHQWLDMLTEDDFKELTKVKTVGEICCRFFDSKGKEVYENLQERTIAISLEDLKNIPQSLAVAYGDTKVSSILSVLRANLVNHLITDKNTILKVLEEDGDLTFREILGE
ncbi:sugar-binding domain-containing protein, partial [Streptococcus pneumoniae]